MGCCLLTNIMLDLEMTSGSKKLVLGKCLGYEFLVLWIMMFVIFYDYDDVNCKEVFLILNLI